MHVLVVEPYFRGSHRSWAEGLVANSRHDLHLITHDGGFWKWRVHGAPLTLAAQLKVHVATRGRPDVVMVSDMVNVAALVGLARRELGGAAIALYMHENQLTYPIAPGAVRDEAYGIANWLSACAADAVVFNSRYHELDFWHAVPALLRRFPDHRHTAFVDDVRARSRVVPVGIDAGLFDVVRTHADSGEAPLVLWNHRWEYDKDPGACFRSLEELAVEGVGFRLAIAGESFQTVPPEFDAARQRFADRLVHFGTAPPDTYRDLLRSADVVVSTAHHDFFGLAVAEAIAAGALPVLPNRLAYPELLPADLATRWLYADGAAPTDALRTALTDHALRRADAATAREHLRRLSWPVLIDEYDALFEDLARS